MVATGRLVRESGAISPTVQGSCVETSFEPEKPGSSRNKNRGKPEGRFGAPTISYSQSEGLFASTHAVHGRLASHLCRVAGSYPSLVATVITHLFLCPV